MSSPSLQPETCPRELALILAAAHERSGLDFRCYRPSTLERRVRSRMLTVCAASYGEYLQRLEEEPGEIDLLLERLTIKVSRFFRNAETYQRLEQLLQEAQAAAGPGERLRIWSAGCGNGEEPYSLAMLVRDLPGPAPAGSVCATDVDESALEVARAACYPSEALEEMPAGPRSRHLVPSARAKRPHRVVEGVASLVSFELHDLTAAARPPLGGRFHLVCCRNVLIYLTPAVQRKVLELLVGSLVPGGYLCLGRAELPSASVLPRLEPVERAARIYRLLPAPTPPLRGSA